MDYIRSIHNGKMRRPQFNFDRSRAERFIRNNLYECQLTKNMIDIIHEASITWKQQNQTDNEVV